MALICELSAMKTYDEQNAQVFLDLGGVLRFTTTGHPNMPSPDPGSGLIEFATGLDASNGNFLGELNVAISETTRRYVVECRVSTPHIEAEVSDGTNPVQVVAPVIEMPGPDEIWASFVTVRPLSGAWTKIRIYYKQTWGQQPPPDTSWLVYKIRVWRID